jgi:uncharacterized protein
MPVKVKKETLRLCLACRRLQERNALVRLTVDFRSGNVLLNRSPSGREAVLGRSAYLCKSRLCLEQALKGHRLKSALEGGRGRKENPRRHIKWPLEPSLIHTLTRTCTES